MVFFGFFCLNQDLQDFRITRIKNQDKHKILIIL